MITVKVTAGLVTPDRVAVMRVVPAAAPLAKPIKEMVATLRSELAQLAWDVSTTVLSSE